MIFLSTTIVIYSTCFLGVTYAHDVTEDTKRWAKVGHSPYICLRQCLVICLIQIMVMNDDGDDDDSDLSGSNYETRASKNQLQLGFVKTCSQTTLFIYNQSLLKINQVNIPSSSSPLEV